MGLLGDQRAARIHPERPHAVLSGPTPQIMATTVVAPARETLKTLPGDAVRQIMWRLNDRYDVQMLIQASRSVARGIVARLVADGGRNSH